MQPVGVLAIVLGLTLTGIIACADDDGDAKSASSGGAGGSPDASSGGTSSGGTSSGGTGDGSSGSGGDAGSSGNPGGGAAGTDGSAGTAGSAGAAGSAGSAGAAGSSAGNGFHRQWSADAVGMAPTPSGGAFVALDPDANPGLVELAEIGALGEQLGGYDVNIPLSAVPTALHERTGGGLLLVGRTISSNAIVVATGATGQLAWAHEYTGYPSISSPLSDGGLLLGTEKPAVVRIDSTGAVSWATTWVGVSDAPRGLLETGDGGSVALIATVDGLVVTKLNSLGQKVFSKQLGFGYAFNGIAQETASAGLLIVATKFVSVNNTTLSTIALDATGAVSSSQDYTAPVSLSVSGLAKAKVGNAFVLSGAAGNRLFWANVDAAGVVSGGATLPEPSGSAITYPRNIVTRTDGSFLVAASRYQSTQFTGSLLSVDASGATCPVTQPQTLTVSPLAVTVGNGPDVLPTAITVGPVTASVVSAVPGSELVTSQLACP